MHCASSRHRAFEAAGAGVDFVVSRSHELKRLKSSRHVQKNRLRLYVHDAIIITCMHIIQMMRLRSRRLSSAMFQRKTTFQVPPLPNDGKRFRMPAEEARHTATWLQWPHNYGWDKRHHVERLEPIWIDMTIALHNDERVCIIVYNEYERERIRDLLTRKSAEHVSSRLLCVADK